MVAIADIVRNDTAADAPVTAVSWLMGWATVEPSGTLRIETAPVGAGSDAILWFYPATKSMQVQLTVTDADWNMSPNGR